MKEAMVFNSVAEAAAYTRTLRQSQTIVLTFGSFDLLHIGHARYLKAARAHGDILVVAMDSDQRVRQRKGATRPLVSENARLELVSSLRYVDVVIKRDDGLSDDAIVATIEPNTLVTTEQSPIQLSETTRHVLARIVVLGRQADVSTSSIVATISGKELTAVASKA